MQGGKERERMEEGKSYLIQLIFIFQTGRLFGLIAASESVVALLASLLFNQLYPATLSVMPGLCYLLAAGLVALMTFVVG